MNKKHINIYDAINSLPDELITPEIYKAGIKEGNIKLLDLLPEEYLTEENINAILDSEKNKYSWHTFSLAAIPEKARTQKVCEIAVKKSLENYPDVPMSKRSNSMLLELTKSAEKYIHLLHLVPESSWDTKTIRAGVSSIYGSGGSGLNYRFSGSQSDKKNQIRLLQIFLSYVPEQFKSKELFFSLFDTSLSIKDIDFITPSMFKKDDYYTKMGERNIAHVPADKLNYRLIKAALLSGKNQISDFFDEDKNIKDRLVKVIDNEIADIIVINSPISLSKLPDQFHTKNRLLLALKNNTNSGYTKYIYQNFNVAKFDDEICRAIVSKNEYECPDFADHIWTPDFVNFCLEKAKSCYWFRKMPVRLQTQQNVNTVLQHSISYIQYTKPDLITYEFAVKAHRYKRNEWANKYDYREYVPKHYLEDFQLQTGLPIDFFGGDTTYADLREKRMSYHYCQIGESYVGFFVDKDGREEYNRLMMTRRSPIQFKPSIVFSRIVQTFHVSWFEKLIADNDPQFTPPVPEKGLKGKQRNKYMGVCHVDTVNGTKIYAHSLMGTNVLYTAETAEETYETTSIESMKEKIRKEEKQYEVAY